MHNGPPDATYDTGLGKCAADIATGLNHAVYEDRQDGREHDDSLEPEEPGELIWPKETKDPGR